MLSNSLNRRVAGRFPATRHGERGAHHYRVKISRQISICLLLSLSLLKTEIPEKLPWNSNSFPYHWFSPPDSCRHRPIKYPSQKTMSPWCRGNSDPHGSHCRPIRYPNSSATRKFSRTADGLEITLPDKPLNRIFPIFKIQKWKRRGNFPSFFISLFQLSRSLRAKLTLVLFEYAADIEVKPASIANEVINLNVIVTWGLKLVGFGNDT